MQIAAEEDGGFSLEQQEHFSIDSLELWRDTASAAQSQAQAQSAGEQYLEHLRRTAAQLRVQAASSTFTAAANTSSSSSASSASGESLAAVGVHMQRALVEATQLVQLSGMLKAGHFAGLRTSFRAIRRERGPPLPPLQVHAEAGPSRSLALTDLCTCRVVLLCCCRWRICCRGASRRAARPRWRTP